MIGLKHRPQSPRSRTEKLATLNDLAYPGRLASDTVDCVLLTKRFYWPSTFFNTTKRKLLVYAGELTTVPYRLSHEWRLRRVSQALGMSCSCYCCLSFHIALPLSHLASYRAHFPQFLFIRIFREPQDVGSGHNRRSLPAS